MDVVQPAPSFSGARSSERKQPPKLYFAKPMLGVWKSEIQRFMVGRGLEWREDASNASDKYMRNRVRNEVSRTVYGVVWCVVV